MPATRRTPVVINDAYPYFQVQAIDPTGQPCSAPPTRRRRPTGRRSSASSVFVPATQARAASRSRVSTRRSAACKADDPRRHQAARPHGNSPRSIPATGGIVHFSLTPKAHKLITDAPGAAGCRSPSRSTRAPGTTVKQSMNGSCAFQVSGAAPQPARPARARALTILGETDFVSKRLGRRDPRRLHRAGAVRRRRWSSPARPER